MNAARKLRHALGRACAKFMQTKEIRKPLQCGCGAKYISNDHPYQNNIKKCVHANAGFWMATNIELECPGISATDG